MIDVIMNRIEIRKVFKQGDSLVVTLPKKIVDKLMIKEDDYVVITTEKDVIKIKKYFD